MKHSTTTTPIRLARKRARLPADVLAQRLGISLGWLLTVERAPGLASAELLERLAVELGESPASFAPRFIAGR